MDTFEAFEKVQAALRNNSPLMVFDWIKAANLILAGKVQQASAGLANDWEWTGGAIFSEGRPVKKDDTYVYLASVHAVPELRLGAELLPCYILQEDSPGGKWNAHTYWPIEALEIINAEVIEKRKN